MKSQNNTYVNNILYSCIESKQRGHEQFIESHALGYMISGESHLETSEGKRVFSAGNVGLVRRNQLIKSVKIPPVGGVVKAINIFFDQGLLRKYSIEHNIETTGRSHDSLLHLLPENPFIKGYFDSLLPYFDAPNQLTASMAELKTREAIELLLRIEPELKNILFDFSDPHKIDLEAFMNKNYMFNVNMDHFAKLTGRSLASFKRDFAAIFNIPPSQWLQQKRLSEAYYLIKEKGRKPSDVYLNVGFENLSHFSFAFKKFFGMSPSVLS